MWYHVENRMDLWFETGQAVVENRARLRLKSRFGRSWRVGWLLVGEAVVGKKMCLWRENIKSLKTSSFINFIIYLFDTKASRLSSNHGRIYIGRLHDCFMAFSKIDKRE